jgi:hypothetical protein
MRPPSTAVHLAVRLSTGRNGPSAAGDPTCPDGRGCPTGNAMLLAMSGVNSCTTVSALYAVLLAITETPHARSLKLPTPGPPGVAGEIHR